ncbi:unnamed protein product [Trichobilharzia szidati]|nr:unnamed protein product [Trichobilharzia szidati]
MPPTRHKERLERIQINGINNNTTTTINNTANNINNKNNLNSPHQLRKTIFRLLQHSTIHGLPHISTSSNNIVRLIWFALWLAGLTGFLTNLSYVVAHYLSRPVLTSYHEDHEEFVWPDITFCNAMAPYNLNTQERQTLWNHYVSWARNLSTANQIPKDLFSSIDEADAEEIFLQSLVRSSIPHWRFNVGSAEDMFGFIAEQNGHQGIYLSVSMDGTLSDMPKPWGNYFYTQILQKRYNIPCLNFQITRYLNKSIMKGIEQVAFGIKSNFHSYLIINSSYSSHTIDVYITLPDHFPTTGVIDLTPGYINHVQLQMVRLKRIQENQKCHNRKYSSIIFDADLTTKRLVNDTGGDLCHRLLSQYLYLRECHCYSPFLPYGYFPDLFNISYNKNNNNNSTSESIVQPVLCLNMSVFNESELAGNSNCMYRVFKKYSNSSVYMSLKEAKQCQYYASSPYCDEVKYNQLGIVRKPIGELWGSAYNEARANFLLSTYRDIVAYSRNANDKHDFSEYNKDIFHNESKRQEMLNQLRNNFAIIMIERVSPHGRLVLEENEYPLAQLLSDIGGNMGLWIGISVIGLFEFFELVGFIIYALVNYFKSLYENRLTINSFKS